MYGKLIEFLRVTIHTHTHRHTRQSKRTQKVAGNNATKILHLFLSEKEIHLNSNYFHSRNGVLPLEMHAYKRGAKQDI